MSYASYFANQNISSKRKCNVKSKKRLSTILFYYIIHFRTFRTLNDFRRTYKINPKGIKKLIRQVVCDFIFKKVQKTDNNW